MADDDDRKSDLTAKRPEAASPRSSPASASDRDPPTEGGSYVRRNGKLQLVERTKPYEAPKPETAKAKKE